MGSRDDEIASAFLGNGDVWMARGVVDGCGEGGAADEVW